MVDAALGGKNGINKGAVKNIIGSIHQPDFILFDYSLLKTLPGDEWINGFAEIIKHACIRDELMFKMLERYTIHEYQSDLTLTATLIERNVQLKMAIAMADEHDTDVRLLLNFGHTLGHAIENIHALPHGHAVSIGMVAACTLSEKFMGFHFEEGKRIVKLLQRYHLPVDLESDIDRVFEVLKKDKKREGDFIRFVLLEKIGKGVVKPLPIESIRENLSVLL
jgi:3-dehydroquinate synthase